jgi:hypothetical protein
MNALNLTAQSPTIDFLTAEQLIRRTAAGRFFRVDFLKRSNGALRRMVCRTGVRPTSPREGNRRYRAADHGLVTVWDTVAGKAGRDRGFRSIPVEGIVGLQINGTVYRVVRPGEA